MGNTNITNTDSQYFSETQYSSSNNDKFMGRLNKFWQAFQYYARQVWPWINRLINFLVYETIKVIRGIVKIGLQQVGLFKD